MQKVKLTKNELKRQKDDLKRFTRYLPTLALKKQQLQLEIIKLLHDMETLETEIADFRKSVYEWVNVFAENVNLESLISIEKIEVSEGNVAGVDIPVFEKINFKENPYDAFITPLWVDYGIEAVKNILILKAKYGIFQKQLEFIREELRITSQRVNLFEKVKIPEAKEAIRKIRIFLGDLETAAVITGKIAKKKIQKKIGTKLS